MAAPQIRQAVTKLLSSHEAEILDGWLRRLGEDGALRSGRIKESELSTQCGRFLRALREGFEAGGSDADSAEFAEVREMLSEISRSRALQGFTPRETAVFVFSLPALLAARRDKGTVRVVRTQVFGASVPRQEDRALLTGRGRFIGDIRLDGMLHAAFLRSPHAHARIRAVDVSRALALPGVRAVLTAADIRKHVTTDRLVVALFGGLGLYLVTKGVVELVR